MKKKSNIAIKKPDALKNMAKREGGLLKNGNISVKWARDKLNKSCTHEKTKKRLRLFLNVLKPSSVAKKRKTPVKNKKTVRKRNPLKRNEQVKKAIKLFQRFRLQDPKFIDEINFNLPEAIMQIGRLDGVLYTTTRNNKKESYIHEFTGKSAPLLCASWDGKQLIIIGGSYNFGDEGIKDK